MKYPYKRLRLPGGKLIDQHRLIMQGILCRKLERNEVVHHKDGNPRNNNPCNLMLMTREEHSRLHAIISDSHKWLDGKKHKFQKGYKPHNSRFTYVEADAIREFCNQSKDSLRSIAKSLDVPYGTIQNISSGSYY